MLDGSKIDNAVFFRRLVQNPSFLEDVKQTEEIYLEAVKQDGELLRHVKNQTYAICVATVKQNVKAFEYVDKNVLKR